MRWIGIFFLVAAGVFLCSFAGAQEAPKKTKLDVDAIFKKLDTNNDGFLSRDEFLKLADRFKDKTKAKEKLTMTYEQLMPSAKGISPDQFRKYVESVRKKEEG
jgi:EF-hand domain pair